MLLLLFERKLLNNVNNTTCAGCHVGCHMVFILDCAGVMVYSQWQWPRPKPRQIKNWLQRIVWSCSHCTETEDNTDSYWVLYICHRSGSRPLLVWWHHNGIFTLCGTGTETGTGPGAETTGDNKYQLLSWFRCNEFHATVSTQFYTTHLFPVPVLVSVTAGVNTP